MVKGEHGTIRERGMAERRARIVDAAAELVRGGDVSALTMRSLSDVAGVSVPTVYNLVGGRDEVLIALMERFAEAIESELAALGGDPIDRCFQIAELCVARVTSPTSLVRSVYAEGLGPVLAGTDLTPLRRYGVATGLAILEASERGDLELATTVQLLVESLMSQIAMRLFRWVSADPSPDAARLHAEAAHAVAMTLLVVATDRIRPDLLRRLSAARTTLTS